MMYFRVSYGQQRSTGPGTSRVKIPMALFLLSLIFQGPGCGPEDLAISIPPVVKSNPNSKISCFVIWNTNGAATSVVEFGVSSSAELRITDSALKTEHRVAVIGMHANKTYRLRAISRTADGQEARSGEVTFTTGTLPATIPAGKVTRHDAARVQPGWTLMNISNFMLGYPRVAVMYDLAGKPVWYSEVEDVPLLPSALDVRFLPSKHVLVVGPGLKQPSVELDLSGKAVWTEAMYAPVGMGPLHHHLDRLPDGNFLGLRHVTRNRITSDAIVEFSSAGKILWSWNAFDYFTFPDPNDVDPTHGNSLTKDTKAGAILYSARNMNAIYKIDRATKKILWRFGKGGDFAADPKATDPWFIQQHDPELQPSGNILLYDNGSSDRQVSRVREYQIDEKARTSRIVWEYPGDGVTDKWYTSLWGDADRQPNGNTLITAGTWVPGKQSRIFEVTAARAVVWEMWLPADAASTTGAYRSQRIPAQVETIK